MLQTNADGHTRQFPTEMNIADLFWFPFSAGEEWSVRCVSTPSLLCTVVKVLPVVLTQSKKFYFWGREQQNILNAV